MEENKNIEEQVTEEVAEEKVEETAKNETTTNEESVEGEKPYVQMVLPDGVNAVKETNAEEDKYGDDIFLSISEVPEDLQPELLKNITASGLSFKSRDKLIGYKINDKTEFLVFFAYDTDEEFEEINKAEILSTTKNEDEEEVHLFNLDKILDQTFDWTESIVSNEDFSFAGYKYIIHAMVGTVDVYLTFLKGVLYSSFVDYMYGKFIENFNKVVFIKDSLRNMTEANYDNA